jgi:hypothetical protein
MTLPKLALAAIKDFFHVAKPQHMECCDRLNVAINAHDFHWQGGYFWLNKPTFRTGTRIAFCPFCGTNLNKVNP